MSVSEVFTWFVFILAVSLIHAYTFYTLKSENSMLFSKIFISSHFTRRVFALFRWKCTFSTYMFCFRSYLFIIAVTNINITIPRADGSPLHSLPSQSRFYTFRNTRVPNSYVKISTPNRISQLPHACVFCYLYVMYTCACVLFSGSMAGQRIFHTIFAMKCN